MQSLHGIDRQVQSVSVLQYAGDIPENDSRFRKIRYISDIIFYFLFILAFLHPLFLDIYDNKYITIPMHL